jgi:sugar phosphate isomerase/epimerase
MEKEHSLSRKQFLGAAAGAAAAAAAAGPLASKAFATDGPTAGKNALITIRTLGVQQFSIRDATGRLGVTNNPTPTMGFLGGPTFPDDPTDLGPLVPLPGGFAEVFEYLVSIGYAGIEFFSFNQNAGTLGGRQPTIAEIRSYLDAAGLMAHGTHTGSIGAMYDVATGGLSANGLTQVANAHTLGYDMIGTAGDPSGRTTLEDNPTNPNQIGWAEAARRADVIGAALKAEGIRYYFHPEQNTFRFFDPVANPQLADTHLISWFSDNTNRELVFFTPDILHSYSGRARFPHPVNGPDFDPYAWVTSDPKRFIGYHLKDGNRNPTWPGPPSGGPYTQTFLRTPTFTDAVGVGEGQLGQGTDPDPAVKSFKQFIEVKGKYNRMHMIESDSGPGGTADQGRSLRHAKISAKWLLDK